MGPAAPPWHTLSPPLVTFSLFAVVSVLLRLLRRSGLLLVLPLLRVFGRVRPQGDDDTSHVVTAGPVSRSVRGQTVVQQLPGEHGEKKKITKRPSGCRKLQMLKILMQNIGSDWVNMITFTVKKTALTGYRHLVYI